MRMDSGWDDTNIETAFTPGNRRGHNPVYSTTPVVYSLGVRRDALGSKNHQKAEAAGNANFQLSVPVLRLPGRGLDLKLDLMYNSRLWQKSGNENYFNMDSDWPAAGWSLGFGKLVIVSNNKAMLVDADGTRHSFQKTATGYQTKDGTLIDYYVHPSLSNARAKYANGTIIDFAPSVYRTLYPTTLYPIVIADANGNFIKITYRQNRGPEIETITDTLGRTIMFHYDSNNLLTAISAPGLKSGMRELIRLHYKKLTLNPGFDGTIIPNYDEIYVIDAIYYPATKTGYWFGDTDSYSDYGMLVKVSERHGMGFTASNLNDQGTFNSSGVMTRERRYDYPLHPVSTLTDAPKYQTLTEVWEGMDIPPAETKYNVQMSSNPRKVEVTYPDKTRSVQLSFNAPNQFKDGLVYQTETYDASNRILQKTTFEWEQGAYGSPRLKRKKITDELNQTTAMEFEYGAYNQVIEVREYDYGGVVVLRRVHTDYIIDPNYDGNHRHIFNLPQVIEVYEGNTVAPISHTEYIYDNQKLEDTPGVVGHSDIHNPYKQQKVWVPPKKEWDLETRRWIITEPGYWKTISIYDPLTDYRGNATQIKTYADAAHRTGEIIKTYRYDITGNRIKASTPLCEKSYTYTKETQYAYLTMYTRGAADPSSPVRVVTKASYDFNTGLVLSTTDANGRITQTSYSPITLRPDTVRLPTMASTTYSYDDSALAITETMLDSSGVIAAQNTRRLNGLGLVRREETLAEGSPNIIEKKYDALGRLWKMTRPFRGAQTPQWSETSYDALGRVTWIRAPDSSEMHSYYNETNRPSGASVTPGQTIRTMDAWGRQRWTRTNALGQLVEVIEPNPDGKGSFPATGNLATNYQYNALGKLTKVIHGVQTREFLYDSLGRLIRQYLPEKLKTLDDNGKYQSSGAKWSDVLTYDERSNLTSHTDARGVKTIYDYENDPLNRLKKVTYDTTGFGDTANPILPAASIIYEYMPAGDMTRLSRVTATEICTEEYSYDTEGRISSKKLTMMNLQAFPQVIDYIYDSLNRLTDIRYPAEYGMAGAPRKLMHCDYGIGNQIKGLKVDGAGHISEISQNAANQITSLKIGTDGQLTEKYNYDDKTGFLISQQVQRSNASLLDLSYDYWGSNDYLGPGTIRGRTGQLTSIVNNLIGQKNLFRYDPVGRLKQVTGGSLSTQLWSQEYSYDRYGNRTSVASSGNTVGGTPVPRDGLAAVSYDAKTNRITTAGFMYDTAGNLTRAVHADGSQQRYDYDAAGRLIMIRTGNSAQEINTYGAGMQRLVRETYTTGGTASINKFYAWSGNQVLAEYGNTLSSPRVGWTKSYIYLGSRLCATLTPGGASEAIQYHHPDRLGTRLITNTADTAVKEQVTLPFGAALDGKSTGATNQFFTSYDRSETTGLDYAVNRHYDSQQGRFMQVDPLEVGAVSLVNPQSLNMYAYVQNDPVNATDPMGLANNPTGGIKCTITDGGKSMVCTQGGSVVYYGPVSGGGGGSGGYYFKDPESGNITWMEPEIEVIGNLPPPTSHTPPPIISVIQSDPGRRTREAVAGKGIGDKGGGSDGKPKKRKKRKFGPPVPPNPNQETICYEDSIETEKQFNIFEFCFNITKKSVNCFKACAECNEILVKEDANGLKNKCDQICGNCPIS